jgi:hypothetical protein
MTLNSFRWQVDIVIANIVIADPTCVNLFLQFCTTQGFATFDAAQAKGKNYCDWHPANQFLPLAIEIFSCLHKHVDAFLHDCANVIWSLKEPKGPPLSILITFLCQRIWITLQRMQASSILVE